MARRRFADFADFADRHPRAADALAWTRKWLPPLNFISIHYAYFVGVCLLCSVIFWGSSDPAFSISYTDSLFLVVSAMTEAGLNTVNLSQMTTWQQMMLLFLILLGSTIWVSIWTVLARKHVFERRFKDIVRAERERALHRNATFALPKIGKTFSFRKATTVSAGSEAVLPGTQIPTRPPAQRASSLPDMHEKREGDTAQDGPATNSRPASPDGHIAFVDAPHPRQDAEAGETPVTAAKDLFHLLKTSVPGRHGEFHSLTIEQRERLGGCEYRALRILSYVVPVYFVLWQLLGCVALGAWMNAYAADTARANGINPWWLGIFNGVSAFNNSGMSLLDANMVAFQTAYFVLIVMGMMILAGNTAYPLLLRLIIWSSLKLLRAITPDDAFCDLKVALAFILKFPRRVYTNLFPSGPTWWLLFMLVSLNSVDWVLFELLNIGNAVIEQIPKGPRVLDGLFQALGTYPSAYVHC